MFAAQLLDLIWPLFLLAGWEQAAVSPGITPVTPLDFYHYPFSHSLAAAALWSAAAGSAYFAFKRDGLGSIVIGCGVISHWLLDFISHRPDLPLYPGGIKLGLGLWFSRPATFAVEASAFSLGLLLYLRSTRAAAKPGSFGLAALIAFLIATYLGSVFGPPPPDARVLAFSALSLWLVVPWANWIDRNRRLA